MDHSVTLYGELCKMAEPIDVLFWTKTRVGPRNHVLDGVQMSHGKGAMFGGPGHSKSLAVFAGIANYVMLIQQKRSFSMPGKHI